MYPIRGVIVMKISVAPAIIAVCLFLLSCDRMPGGGKYHAPRADKGIMDVRGLDFPKGPVIDLRGQWEFYWSRLIDPDEFKKPGRAPQTGHLDLPGLWNGYRVDDKVLDGMGYATFRLTILVPPGVRLYGLKITEFESSYRMWVNGKLIAETGVVGADAGSSKPSWKRAEAYFQENSSVLDVVLHVSNFSHNKGGPEEVIRFGSAEGIARYKSGRYGIELFLAGSILIMALYHFIIFFIRRTDRSALFFALLCLCVSIKTTMGGEKVFLDMIPRIDWTTAVRIEYLLTLSSIPLFMLFFQHVFRNEISIWAVRSAVAVFCVLGAVILATDAVFFTMLGPAMIALVLLFGLYAIVPVTMALTRKRQGAALFLGGLVVLFLSVVNDFLFNTMLVDTTFLIPAGYSIGLFIFILSQSSVLALRFSSAFATVAELSRDLEKRVDERTAELQDERNKLAKIAIEDDLTGLYNRRYSLEYLKSEFYRFSRYGAVFSVLIIDLDHFKKVNDTYGHLAGDTLLREIGSVLKAMMRMSDVCGRFGGEEFIIVLPGTGMDAAAALAEKIRARIEALELTAGDSRYSVSCSIGLSQANGADGNYNVVLQRADSALYAAKDRGRNRVVCME